MELVVIITYIDDDDDDNIIYEIFLVSLQKTVKLIFKVATWCHTCIMLPLKPRFTLPHLLASDVVADEKSLDIEKIIQTLIIWW